MSERLKGREPGIERGHSDTGMDRRAQKPVYVVTVTQGQRDKLVRNS